VRIPPLPQPKQVLDLATRKGCKAELTYVTWKRLALRQTDRQTNRQTCDICSNRPHLCAACRRCGL